MQIRIEIDVKPEELRRFLGLPDVAGLQEEVIQFLRDKVADANESFDPSTFVKSNLSTLTRSKAWRRLMDGVRAVEEEEMAGEAASAKASARTAKPRRKSASPRRRKSAD
jgi:hypothetical protein